MELPCFFGFAYPLLSTMLSALPFAKYELERDGQDRSEPEKRSRLSLGTAEDRRFQDAIFQKDHLENPMAELVFCFTYGSGSGHQSTIICGSAW